VTTDPKTTSDAPKEVKADFKEVQRSEFGANLVTKPHLVTNHIDRGREILVQDAQNQLALISRDGKILWRKNLAGRLVENSIQQIDFYNNGKLQYALATDREIFVLDRLGRALPNFPVKLPERAQIQSLTVIDYDNSKDYRFLAADQNGRLYLYDKEGKGLDGWNPKTLSPRLASAAVHRRIGSKDCFLAIQRDGTANLIKRNAKQYPNFPIRFETPIGNPFLLFDGNKMENTEVLTLSELGELLRFNFKGEILKREKLPSEGEMRFSLIPDAVRGDTWVSVRKDDKGFSVLSAEGRERFRVSTPKAKTADFQYYRFRAGREWLVWLDRGSQKAEIFDALSGEKVLSLDTVSEIALLYSESKQELNIFRTYGKLCQKLRMKGF
ncbi:MAG: hypothetical protein AAF740_13380, partial [Bacteroidota bacterium]